MTYHYQTFSCENRTPFQDILDGKPSFYYAKLEGGKEAFQLVQSHQKIWFLPKSKENYQVDMIRNALYHVTSRLNEVKETLHPTLFSKMGWYLYLLSVLLESDGWNENRMELAEVKDWNTLVEKPSSYDWGFHLKYGTSTWKEKELSFLYYEGEEEVGFGKYKKMKQVKEIRSESDVNETEMKTYESIICMEKSDATKEEQLLNSVLFLTEFLKSLRMEQSYVNMNIAYDKGQTDSGIHQEWIRLANQLGFAMEYCIHSQSWKSNDWLIFDEIDIKRREYFVLSEDLALHYQTMEG